MNHVPHFPIHRMYCALLCAIALTACSAAAPSPQSSESSLAVPANAPAQPAPPSANTQAQGAVSDTSPAQVAARLIVRNASLTLIVADTEAELNTIAKLATDLGGYVASTSTQKFDEGVQGKVTLRVPVDKLDTALERLRKLAVEVREEQISGEDVTAEYTDLNSRQKNLEAAEAQLRDIMSKATKTEDVMAVFNQLTQIRGEIEQVKGRILFLSQSANLATINLMLIPDKLAQPVQVAGWRPEGVVKSAVEALIAALQGIATLTIWLIIVVLPIGLVIASPFILLIYLLRRRSKRKQLAQGAGKS